MTNRSRYFITDVFTLGHPDPECRHRMLNAFPGLSKREENLAEIIVNETTNMSHAFALTFLERLSLYVKEHNISELKGANILEALKELEGRNKKVGILREVVKEDILRMYMNYM